jgi:hypothetical protein
LPQSRLVRQYFLSLQLRQILSRQFALSGQSRLVRQYFLSLQLRQILSPLLNQLLQSGLEILQFR